MRRSRLADAAAAFGNAVLDLLYPPRCAACDEGISSPCGGPFCSVCSDALEPVPPGCARCGLPGPDPLCGACLADPPSYESCRAGGLFGGPLADAIHALKYRDRPALARPLGDWLARRVALPRNAALVSVPLGRRRRLARGYDQAALLARALWISGRRAEGRSSPPPAAGGRRSPASLELLPRALARTRETKPQVGRSRAERLENVRGAFRATREVSGRDILLVDDVVTTGATAQACAEALTRAGARSVRVIALARAD